MPYQPEGGIVSPCRRAGGIDSSRSGIDSDIALPIIISRLIVDVSISIDGR